VAYNVVLYDALLIVSFVLCVVLSRIGTDMVAKGDLGPMQEGKTTKFEKATYGSFLQVFFLPPAFAIGGAVALSAHKRSKKDRRLWFSLADALLMFVLLMLAVWACVSSWDSDFGKASNLFSCGVIFCFKTDDDDFGINSQAGYFTNIGMITFIVSICAIPFLAVLLLVKISNAFGFKKSGDHDEGEAAEKNATSVGSPFFVADGQEENGEQRHDRYFSSSIASSSEFEKMHVASAVPHATPLSKALKALFLLGGIFFVFLMCAWLPPSFQKFTRSSLQAWVAQKLQNTPRWNSEHDDGAVTFLTSNWRMASNLVLKVYPDVGIYYGFLFFLATLGLASHTFPRSVGAFLHRRILLLEDSYPPKWWWSWIAPPPWSISFGGIAIAVAFVVTFALFLRYWAHDHVFHGNDPQNMGNAELTARTLGQVANFLMGLMLLPVSKVVFRIHNN
jgi:hypothetical protein